MFSGVALFYKGTLTCPGALRRYQLTPSAMCVVCSTSKSTQFCFLRIGVYYACKWDDDSYGYAHIGIVKVGSSSKVARTSTRSLLVGACILTFLQCARRASSKNTIAQQLNGRCCVLFCFAKMWLLHAGSSSRL